MVAWACKTWDMIPPVRQRWLLEPDVLWFLAEVAFLPTLALLWRLGALLAHARRVLSASQ